MSHGQLLHLNGLAMEKATPKFQNMSLCGTDPLSDSKAWLQKAFMSSDPCLPPVSSFFLADNDKSQAS